MLPVIFSLLCVLTDRGLCGLPDDDSKESKSVLLTNYLWEVLWINQNRCCKKLRL